MLQFQWLNNDTFLFVKVLLSQLKSGGLHIRVSAKIIISSAELLKMYYMLCQMFSILLKVIIPRHFIETT